MTGRTAVLWQNGLCQGRARSKQIALLKQGRLDRIAPRPVDRLSKVTGTNLARQDALHATVWKPSSQIRRK